jgi:hypothetical protein
MNEIGRKKKYKGGRSIYKGGRSSSSKVTLSENLCFICPRTFFFITQNILHGTFHEYHTRFTSS